MALEFVDTVAQSTAIALIDTSGSVFGRFAGATIYEKFRAVLEGLPHEQFRLCFWSSKDYLNDGTFKFPFAVKRGALSQPFQVVAGKQHGGTEASLGFKVIDEWMAEGTQTVYLLTDGTIWDKQEFPGVMRAFVAKWPDVQLHLVTVEAKDVDFEGREDIDGLVGADIYAALVGARLTGMLSSFTSYTRNHTDGYKHIDRTRAPPGYLSFRSQLFRDAQMPQFFQHVRGLVAGMDATDEAAMLRLLQDLVTPVARACRDKAPNMARATVTNFASLFRGSCIDNNMAVFLLSDGCDADNSGRVQLLSNLRAQLKEAFKQANLMLRDDVRNACAMAEWVSLPMAAADGRVIVFRGTALNKAVDAGQQYRNGAVEVGGALVGGLPLKLTLQDRTDDAVQGGMAEQCTRQWVRAVVAKTYGLNATEDAVIYYVMAIAAWVDAAAEDAQVRAGWATLARIMLRKKRLHAAAEEWDLLERGETPTPNSGTVDDFLAILGRVRAALCPTSDATPWQLWWALCRPLGLTNQLRHCEGVDAGHRVQWPPLVTVALTDCAEADYRCIITMEDTTASGGMRLSPHTSLTGMACRPAMVFSMDGVAGLLASDCSVCPYCYKPVGQADFEAVPPYTPPAPDVRFETDALGAAWVKPRQAAKAAKARGAGPTAGKAKSGCVVVHLKGAVGCGKSVFTKELRAKLEGAGKTVTVLSVDVHAVATGGNFGAAIAATKRDAAGAGGSDVIIVDTCGDVDASQSLFGLDVSACTHVTVPVNFIDKQSVRGLVAFSLHNVLARDQPGTKDGVTVSLTAQAGVNKCVEVWRRKATAAYSGDVKGLPQVLKSVPKTANAKLADLASEYAARLAAEGVRERQLAEVCSVVGV